MLTRRACPMCDGVEVQTERRMDGDSHCVECGHSGPTRTFDSTVIEESDDSLKVEVRVLVNDDTAMGNIEHFDKEPFPSKELSNYNIISHKGKLYRIAIQSKLIVTELGDEE